MLPVTNENNTANLNATFVTDNSLEVAVPNGNIEQSSEEEIAEVVEVGGNIEAETNKTVSKSIAKKEDMNSHESTTMAVEQTDVKDAVNQPLTSENNEDSNNRANESSYSDFAVDAPTATDDNTMPPSTTERENDLRIQLTEENIEELATESIEINDGTEVGKSVDDSTEFVGESYVSNNNREDISSSDDEEGDAGIEMHPEFIAEWAELQDNLVKKDDERNDLTNHIDDYDAVPVDLSNDIAINELAAARTDFLINPNAEIITLSGTKRSGVIEKFEKMSIATTMDPTTYEVDSSLASDK